MTDSPRLDSRFEKDRAERRARAMARPNRDAEVARATAEAEAKRQREDELRNAPLVETVASQVKAGDFLVSVGGKTATRSFKRYRYETVVTDAFVQEGQRTRCHIVTERVGHEILRQDYPVKVRRAQ